MFEQAFYWAIGLVIWFWLMVLKGCAIVLTWVVPPLDKWLNGVYARLTAYHRGLVMKRRDSIMAEDDQGPVTGDPLSLLISLVLFGEYLGAISMACFDIVRRLYNLWLILSS